MTAALKPGTPEAERRVQEVLEHSRDVLDRAKLFKPAPRFALLDDEEIAQLPTPLWLIDNTLPSNALVVLFGEKGSLKTFLALMWSLHVTLGLDWHDRAVRSGTVVYLYSEGRTGIGPRVAALKRYYGIDGKLGILFLPRRVTVNDAGDCKDLLEAIAARTAPAGVGLIVVDTLNRNMDGNENSSEDMGAFVRGCDTLREATGATVVAIHHKGHGDSDRSRGSSVLEAAADTVIFCSRDDDRLTLECKKQKDAAEFGALVLEVLPVAPSLVLKPSGVSGGVLKGQRLHILTVLHENYTDEGATYKAWMEASGLGQSSFNKAREWLRTNVYVKSSNGKWKVTDAGRLALNSTQLHQHSTDV